MGSITSPGSELLRTSQTTSGEGDGNAVVWATLLGYKTDGDQGSTDDQTQKSSDMNLASQPTLLEQNRVAIPLGVALFVVAMFILGSSTYGYNRTHTQLTSGSAFAGNWRYVVLHEPVSRPH
jgi:hypothetical protein